MDRSIDLAVQHMHCTIVMRHHQRCLFIAYQKCIHFHQRCNAPKMQCTRKIFHQRYNSPKLQCTKDAAHHRCITAKMQHTKYSAHQRCTTKDAKAEHTVFGHFWPNLGIFLKMVQFCARNPVIS